ncbi:2680_t:CDS:2, partial [Racocetra persica]
EQYAKKLADAGITNFEQLKECEPWRIETACNRYPPFGHNVHEAVATLPNLKLDIEHVMENPTRIKVSFQDEYSDEPTDHLFLGLDVYKTIVPDNQSLDVCNNLIAPIEPSHESPKKFEINKLPSETNRVQHQKQGVIESKETYNMKEKEKQHDSNIKGPELLPNGRVKCNHPCKDKQKCAHECCKIGCRRAPKKRKNNNITSSPTFSYDKQLNIDESIFNEEMKSQPVIHDEYGFLDQSWFEIWNEFDLISIVDLDED